MSTQAPETLAQERFVNPAKRAETKGAGSRFGVPPLRSSGTPGTPETRTPKWVAERVARSRRAAQHQPCPKCHADTLVGPDHDTVAYVARVDTTPVDPIHEVAGLLTGRFSFDLVRGELHARLDHHHHSSSRRYPVLLTHVCHETRLF